MNTTTARRRSYALGPQTANRYTRESVERALVIHYGPEGPKWISNGAGGYKITTRLGIIELRTLREAALWVWAVADTKAEATEATA